MILRPCMKCRWKDNCDRRDSLRAYLKGTGLTTASFKCERRWKGLQPGARVVVTTIDEVGYDNGSYEEPPQPIHREVEVAGTVMHRAGLKVRVWLDEPLVSSGTVRMRAWPCNVKPTGETMPVCEQCGCPSNKANRDKWHCPRCEAGETQQPCVTTVADSSNIPW